MNWQAIWSVCLIGSVSAFAVVAVIVAIGGAFDIRRMLRRLEKDRD